MWNRRRISSGELEQRPDMNASNQATLDSFLRFAELMLGDIAAAWERQAPNNVSGFKICCSQMVFATRPGDGFLNRSNSSLFNMLEEVSSEEGMLASPTGFEPVLPP